MPQLYLPLLLLILLLCNAQGIRVTRTGDCELSGQCRNCGDGRYSYYRCLSQEDCFPGENCGGNGFCCPNAATFPLVSTSFQNESIDSTPSTVLRSTVSHPIPLETKCHDGYLPDSTCMRSEDCADRHICVEGKCCAECSLRREQVLHDLPSNDISDVLLPQCEPSGRLYRPKQCTPSSSRCICVSAFGSLQSHLSPYNGCSDKRRKEMEYSSPLKLREELTSMMREICADSIPKEGYCPSEIDKKNRKGKGCECDEQCPLHNKCCSIDGEYKECIEPIKGNPRLTVTFLENSLNDPTMCNGNEHLVSCFSSCEPSCSDLSTLPCPTIDCRSGCMCRPGFVRRDPSPHSPCVPRQLCTAFDSSSNCADPRRQYLTCGSACPISCDSRNSPRCIERCVSGCFCRIPYILENETDPLHSRCILPAECPLSPPPPLSPLPPGPITFIQTTPNIPIPTPMNGNRCSDPLKNFLTCGSSCPRSCSNQQPSCTSTCTQGCFCRQPYILINGPDSACVLPQICPPSETKKTCSDPRMEWSQCGANECARSCRQPHGGCLSGVCKSGCVCREPYVLSDEANPRCVLPAECANCENPKKEYLRCGSSCPVGCDNPSPRSCTPCRSGCFCKNGFVFANSTDWINSECITVEECELSRTTLSPSTTTTTPTPTTTTTTQKPTTTSTTTTKEPLTTTEEVMVSRSFSAREPQRFMPDQDLLLSAGLSICPTSTSDVSGRPCNFNTDCPNEQICCRSLVLPLSINPQRCTCPDPNSAWNNCGSLCPEYCGVRSPPVCSNTCNPGCSCLPGFVRARNDMKAPCVRKDQCPGVSSTDTPSVFASANNDPFLAHQIAVAHLYSSSTSVRGRVSFSRLSTNTLRVHGLFDSIPFGTHAIVVHQFGDISMNCTKLGPILIPRSSTSGLLGDIHAKEDSAELIRLVEWSPEDILGRSVAVYEESTMEWSLRSRERPPLACGTIGVTKFRRR